MKIILLKSIHGLGNLGEEVRVSSGYARNFLIPKGIALSATRENMKHFEDYRLALKKELIDSFLLAKRRSEEIKKIGQLEIFKRSGKEGRLFGSVGIRDIEKSFRSLGVKINRREIRLPEGILRKIGTHQILIQLHQDISFPFLVSIRDISDSI